MLAVNGGSPIRTSRWPAWPRPAARTEELLSETVHSGRWALSGPWMGRPAMEQRFAELFAAYNGTPHCIPTASGTSALIIGLESLGIGAGDEVIVPGLTWVASASTVLAVNAVPVLVDIDPETLCLDPAAVEAAITARTRAISVVHLYCAMAQMDRIMDIAERHELAVIEDCAQAHGARWRGRRAGTLGSVGTFSMQQTKLLTAGEGGAVITSDDALAERLYQLRADGRRRAAGELTPGEMELVDRSELMGNNYCMSEFSAAILISQLETLDQENELRATNARRLTDRLVDVPGVHPVATPTEVTTPTYYQYAVRINREEFAGRTTAAISRALDAEVSGGSITTCYAPLNCSPLYRPHTKTRYGISPEHRRRIDPGRYELPEAERAHQEVITLPHSMLLTDTDGIDGLAMAFAKVRKYAEEISA
nr:DegT/DnrJ/EryC1/StrS family aminotransferase [Nocardia brasiliensis]